MTTHNEWAPPTVPASHPAPPYQPPTRRRSRRKSLLIGFAIFIVGAAIISVVTDAARNDGREFGRVGQGNGRSQTGVTSPKADLNDMERILYRHSSFYDCDPIASASLMDGAVAGISCDASKSKNAVNQRVEYYKFKNNPAMSSAYSDRLASLEASPGVTVVGERGWCLTTMSLPCYASDGRALFYRKGGSVHAEWTYFPNKTYSTATRRGPNMAKLQALWRGAGPE